MPADGIKGKTWGPSTLHQRERGHLPALQRPTARPPHFSKSAPNLDKSRMAIAALIPPSSSRNDILGKSYDDFNTMNSSTSNSIRNEFSVNYLNNNRRIISTDDYLNNNNDHNYGGPIEYDTYDDDIDDDDDDDVQVKGGCFGFIRTEPKSDKITHDHMRIINSSRPGLRSVRIPPVRQRTVELPLVMSHEDDDDMSLKCEQRNFDDVPYDRVFYRTMQKSLDDIFAPQPHQFLTPQNARNSKSSGDLTAGGGTFDEGDEDSYGTYRFQRGGSESKFDRDCFFTNNNNTTNNEGDGGSANNSADASENASFASSSSHTTEHTRKPMAGRRRRTEDIGVVGQPSEHNSLDDSFALLTMSSSNENSKLLFDERKNSMCSDHSSVDLFVPSITSRKSSVTFRNSVDVTIRPSDDDDANYRMHHPATYGYANDGASTDTDVTAALFPCQLQQRKHFDAANGTSSSSSSPVTVTPLGGSGNAAGDKLKSALRQKKEKIKSEKSRLQRYKGGLSRLWKFSKSKSSATVTHSNSFYSKFDSSKGEMTEKLLDDSGGMLTERTVLSTTTVSASSPIIGADVIDGTDGVVDDEPHYGVIFRTKNFVGITQTK